MIRSDEIARQILINSTNILFNSNFNNLKKTNKKEWHLFYSFHYGLKDCDGSQRLLPLILFLTTL